MEKILEILEEIQPDVDFEKEAHLITDGILDSFDVVTVAAEIDAHSFNTSGEVELPTIVSKSDTLSSRFNISE